AAVFSYVMLGAGFFATGEAQQVVHTGSEQASSSLEIIGNVYGTATTAGADNLESIQFTVGNTAGGTPIDISQMLVTFTCKNQSAVIAYDATNAVVNTATGNGTTTAGNWTVNATYNDIGDTNHLLEPGEQFVLTIMFPTEGANVLEPNTPFTVNLQPAVGAVYPIKKTVPAYLNKVNTLN
ncbi:MAG: flagellin, partial [Methanoculleus sp.]|nr:flagellin [Methanoculleus sp.]